jgi:hypothetical protein
MEWEQVLLLVLALPFVLYNWMISGLGRLTRRTSNKSVGQRTVLDAHT